MKALLKRAIPGWRSRPAAWGCLLSLGIGLRLVVSIKVSSEIGVLGSLLAQRKWDALFRRQRLVSSLVERPGGQECERQVAGRALLQICGHLRDCYAALRAWEEAVLEKKALIVFRNHVLVETVLPTAKAALPASH